jgi:pseudaminic acid cytidylyltransferase
MNLAVIPARGGSKRIARKNVRPFGGRPMIAYAIAAARDAQLFAHILVTTDDEEIARVALECGADSVLQRPPELANDHATTLPVIAHALGAFAASHPRPDHACCIYPCVPLLEGSDLASAYALFTTTRAEYVYPVVRFQSTPFRAMLRSHDGRMQFLHPEHELSRTQDLAHCYHDAGQFYWGRAAAWEKLVPMHSHGVGWEIDGNRVVDIDTPEDWRRAELLARVLKD